MLEARASGRENTYYSLLVRGFRAGQLSLKMDVPPGLLQLRDPYDPTANSSYRWADGGPTHDLSYYNGKFYLYFGVTPALVLFWPYTLLTGHYLLHKDAAVIFYSIGFLASAGLLWAIWRRYFAQVGLAVIAAGTLALGLAPFIPMTLPRCDVYEVAVSCGYALMMLTVAVIWCALHDPPPRSSWWLASASLCCGLAVGARPSLLFTAVILLVPVAQAWRERRPIWVPLLAATGPIALIGSGLMLYNALRFSNPFEFGMHHALASCRMDTARILGWHYLAFNSWAYFLAPMHWGERFPFVRDITVPPLPAGYFGTEHAFGVLANVPLVWLSLAAPLAWPGRSPGACSRLREFLTILALVVGTCALTLGFFFAACARYQVEFVPALILLAVIGILGIERALLDRPAWRWLARCGWGLLLAYSVAFNLAAARGRQAETSAYLGNLILQRGRVDEAIAQYQRALEINPDLASAHTDLANALLKKRQVEEAIIHAKRAVEIEPHVAGAHNNLAIILLKARRADEAITQFESALRIAPRYTEAHLNLAKALLERKQVEAAIPHLEAALDIQPELAGAHFDLANALVSKGEMDKAITHFQRALRLKPDLVEAHNNLANALLRNGQAAEAVAHYEAAVKASPNDPYVRNNLAYVLATYPDASVRNGARAVELARQADQLSGGNDPRILGTLADACAETGEFAEAVTTAQRAVMLATTLGNTAQAEVLRGRIALYQTGSPFHYAGATNSTARPSPP
jgi:tetratricopeptide (TPR) repeat protein